MPKVNWTELGLSGQELACIYSAAILADDDITVTSQKIITLLKAANVDFEPIWPSLYAKALQGQNVKELIASSVTSGAACASSGGAGVGASAGADTSQPAEEAKPAAKPQEEEEDSDEDFGLSLFD